jgi:hypothetical protein
MTGDLLAQSDRDAVLPVSIGTVAWLAVLIALIVARPALDDNGTTWWIGAAAVGVVSGAGGVLFLKWRRKRARPSSGQE